MPALSLCAANTSDSTVFLEMFLYSALIGSFLLQGRSEQSKTLPAYAEDDFGKQYIPSPAPSQYALSALCDRMNKDVVVFIYSKLDDFKQREDFRSHVAEFGNITKNVGILFPVGTEKTGQKVQTNVTEEMKTHGDVFQGDFIDTYHNLGLKFMATMSFLRRTCNGLNSKHKYIVKLDIDHAWNLPAMYEWTRQHELEKTGLVVGRSAHEIPVEHGITRNHEPQLRHMKMYPDFIYGGCALFDTTTADVMLKNREHFPYFTRNDDVYFGLLTQGSGVKLQNDWRFVNHNRYGHCVNGWIEGNFTVPSQDCDCSNWFCVDAKSDEHREILRKLVLDCHHNATTLKINPAFDA